MLDFASGFGRVTRFLVEGPGPGTPPVPAERIWVADVQAAGPAFQHERLGVHALASSADPAAFAPGRRFDAVLCASLFTHLPRPSFERWLARLWELVEPGGVLAFSVNDEAILWPGRAMPPDGFYFEAVSESRALELAEYGSCWLREEVVREIVARVAAGQGEGPTLSRHPRALWSRQDLYVLTRREAPTPGEAGEPRAGSRERPLEIDLEPIGFVEAVEWTRTGDLRLRGWAADRDPNRDPDRERRREPGPAAAPGLRVSAAFDALPPHAAALTGPRADADDFLGLAGAAGEGIARGWEVVLPGREAGPGSQLLVKARSARGREHVLFCGSLDAACLETALRASRQQADEQAREIAELGAHLQAADRHIRWMESRPIWRLRKALAHIKHRLRQT